MEQDEGCYEGVYIVGWMRRGYGGGEGIKSGERGDEDEGDMVVRDYWRRQENGGEKGREGGV